MTKYDFIEMMANATKTAIEERETIKREVETGAIKIKDGMWCGYSGYGDDDFSLTYDISDDFWAENDMIEIIIWHDGQMEIRGKGEYKDFVASMSF